VHGEGMRESYFHGEWIKSWRHYYPDCHIEKIPDMPKSAQSRFIPHKPYDIFAVFGGKFYAMELKLRTQLRAFSVAEVKESQLNKLAEAKRNGAYSYIVFNYRINKITERQKKKYGLPEGRFDLVFFIDVDDFIKADKETWGKSIPFESFLKSICFKKMDKENDSWRIPVLTKIQPKGESGK